MRYVFIGLVLIVVSVCGSSCGRVAHRTKTDTVYVHKIDTFKVFVDTNSLKRVDSIIDYIFVEVEKECPNISKVKVDRLKNTTKKACTIQELTGGQLKGETPDGKGKFTMKFTGNDATVIWESWEPTIIKQPIKQVVKKMTLWEKVKFAIIWLGSLIIAYFFGRIRL